jgi:hypothetical protein
MDDFFEDVILFVILKLATLPLKKEAPLNALLTIADERQLLLKKRN